MKKIFLVAFLIVTATLQKGFANNNADTLGNSDPLNSVLTSYLDLKNALAKDDGNSANTSATELFKAIDKVQADKLTPDQQKIWKKYNEKLSYDAEHIKGTLDIEHQREHFVSLSKNMYEVVKGFNTNSSTVYYQFCPMANNGKGASWLSELEKINNPYMGKKMPGCGSVKETIKNK